MTVDDAIRRWRQIQPGDTIPTDVLVTRVGDEWVLTRAGRRADREVGR